jgi:GTP-binding protein
MKKSFDVRFVTSAHTPKGFPTIKSSRGTVLPEVVVIGRSNVGKSSLLNDLFGVKGLVKTSSLPGKTRLVNFFTIDEKVTFVDVHGFGYSSASKKTQESFMRMVRGYFETRDELKLVLFLFDIRRDPHQEDLSLLSWLVEEGHQTILVLTKADKIATTKRKHREKIVKEMFEVQLPIILYSTTASIGREKLWHAIEEGMGG